MNYEELKDIESGLPQIDISLNDWVIRSFCVMYKAEFKATAIGLLQAMLKDESIESVIESIRTELRFYPEAQRRELQSVILDYLIERL